MPPMLNRSLQSTRWCFTIYFRDALDAESPCAHDVLIRTFKPGVYGGWQVEKCPTTDRIHCQGFCVVAAKTTRTGMKKNWSAKHFVGCDDVHWEVMVRPLEHSEAYCSDPAKRYPGEEAVTWGTRPYTGQGTRSDLHRAIETLRQSGIKAVAEQHPDVFVKFSSGLHKLQPYVYRPPPAPSPTTWREWQETLLAELDGEPDPRKIIWYYDQSGAAGKSTLVRHLCSTGKAQLLEGKVADMAFAYDDSRIVFFDVSRTQSEHMDHLYSFAEKLKNGLIFSAKYESRLKYFKVPHVIFMSNSLPDYGKWSSDRYDVRTLQPLDF